MPPLPAHRLPAAALSDPDNDDLLRCILRGLEDLSRKLEAARRQPGGVPPRARAASAQRALRKPARPAPPPVWFYPAARPDSAPALENATSEASPIHGGDPAVRRHDGDSGGSSAARSHR